MMAQRAGRQRVVIEGVNPELDGGRFPVKRIIGEYLAVEADIYADGHDAVAAALLYRKEGAAGWHEVPMAYLVNDRWRGAFKVSELGEYEYTLIGWVDRFQSWQQNLAKKAETSQSLPVDFIEGALIIEEISQDAQKPHAEIMWSWAALLRSPNKSPSVKLRLALSKKLAKLMARYPDRQFATTYHRELRVRVDRQQAVFSTWYEMFPRSCSDALNGHGTFRDCEARLPYIAEMGFGVLYLPPIHPIGSTNRKGKNNNPIAVISDPGTPWAIGSKDGGHKAIHPQLGSLVDFHRLVARAREHGIEIALDIAFQCSPDHPYVKEHPDWFQWRPDGTVQYAENPPKKYEDIYPLKFDTEHWPELWAELKDIVLFWIQQGVFIFRVDNPHTKPFAFWEWLIKEVKKEHPAVIFLSEAFTRPKVMYQLAKIGFSQSYTYFTWRNVKWELTQYFTELNQTEVKEFFRPNLWPNTPDILSDYLRDGGRPAFMIRLVLAATLGSNYGIYGPAFELCENQHKDTASEEYLNSEKYEIKNWDITSPDSLKEFIKKVNIIRRENPALQSNASLRFHQLDNDNLICYSKSSDDKSNVILVVVNLDCRYKQSGWTNLHLDALGLDNDHKYQVNDLLNDTAYVWHGPRNYVALDPVKLPAHIFRLSQKLTM